MTTCICSPCGPGIIAVKMLPSPPAPPAPGKPPGKAGRAALFRALSAAAAAAAASSSGVPLSSSRQMGHVLCPASQGSMHVSWYTCSQGRVHRVCPASTSARHTAQFSRCSSPSSTLRLGRDASTDGGVGVVTGWCCSASWAKMRSKAAPPAKSPRFTPPMPGPSGPSSGPRRLANCEMRGSMLAASPPMPERKSGTSKPALAEAAGRGACGWSSCSSTNSLPQSGHCGSVEGSGSCAIGRRLEHSWQNIKVISALLISKGG
mmetsp:Transcript_11714/g.37220  ORF Transcript_11714/g.37220 Transcript_11714/m.37220 type:complete len:262 (-) Transcript_11714:147-932(-)